MLRSLTRLVLVAVLFVGAGLLACLTFEQHSKILSSASELRDSRVSYLADPRVGEDVYEWLVQHYVTIPLRWVYLRWVVTAVLFSGSAWLMLRRTGPPGHQS